MKSQGVVNIENISVKDSSGGRRSTNTFVVTFRLPTLPKHVTVGYMRVPVDLYIPYPLRCFKCQKFGHGSKACKGTETCARCGQSGHNGDCSNEQSVLTGVADIPPSVRNAEKQNHIVTCTLQNTVTALATLTQKKYNKPLALPLTDDLVM